MKIKFLFIAFTALPIFFISCKKENDGTSGPAASLNMNMSGTKWSGPAKTGPLGSISVTVNLTFNADGTLTGTLTSPASFAIAGTWSKMANSSIVNMNFTVDMAPGTYTGQATLNSAGNKLENGTAMNSSNTDYNVTFILSKV